MADNSIKSVNNKVLNLLKDSGDDGLHVDDIVYLLGCKTQKELIPRLRDLRGRGEIKEVANKEQEVAGNRWKLVVRKVDESGELPKVNLPGDEKFSSYKNTLQEYCQKKYMGVPQYGSVGLIGTVTFRDTHVRCKEVAIDKKEATHRAAFEALKKLGYIKDNTPFELVSQLKRKIAHDNDAYKSYVAPQKQSKPNNESVTFKSKLNSYVQKKQLATVVYDTVAVNDGFFSTVHVDGKKFKGMSTCLKRKDAEQSAAQVAFADLIGIPLSGEAISIGEADVTKMVTEARQASEPVDFKGHLQEICTKLGNDKPIYETNLNDSGDTYQATVTVRGVEYLGPFVKRKKHAEAKAAEEAVKALESIM